MSTGIICLLALTSYAATESRLVFNCAPDNDVYTMVTQAGVRALRYSSSAEAIERARPGASVLIMADAYPAQTTRIEEKLFDLAAAKDLTLYIEFPHAVPGLDVSPSVRTVWERIVVTGPGFGTELPPMRILTMHDCRYTPVSLPEGIEPLLVVARVAGFDTAVFGLPDERHPLLFDIPERKLIVATSPLSGFVSGRFAPLREWQYLWKYLLARLDPELSGLSLSVTPPVRPAYRRDEPLPDDVESRTLRRAAEWYFKSRLLIHADRESDIHRMLLDKKEDAPIPGPDAPIGDGSHGILEGFASAIQYDGHQRARLPLRSDCHAESAMCLALDWMVNSDPRSRDTAGNLLDYVFFTSEFCSGVRGDPHHPAFGLVAWGAIAPAWSVANYGDDDARVIQAAILASAALQTDRWNKSITRALLANLRTTGSLGFRGNRIDIPPLERHGWKHYHDAPTVNYAPHYEAALWACYLWGYARTGHAEFLDKAKTATRMTMEAYPDQWLWQNDLERARMVLTLAWLVQVEDTPEHRAWLQQVASDLLEYQDRSGAIPCRLGTKGSRHFLAPTTNEEYGTREVPLIQENGDPVADQLYTTGFALLALHEAAAATGDPTYKRAEDKLAEFICRVQIHSERFPYLDGGWFRAFDYGRWDYWASSGDVGWGAWCIEAGWGQAWATAALALRRLGRSMWEMTAETDIARQLEAVQEEMALNDGRPWRPQP